MMLHGLKMLDYVGPAWWIQQTGALTHSGLDERLYSGLNLFSDFGVQKGVNGSTFSLLSRNKINGKDIADEHAYLEGNTFSSISIFSV